MSLGPQMEACAYLGDRALALLVATNECFGLEHQEVFDMILAERFGDLLTEDGKAVHTFEEVDAIVSEEVDRFQPNHKAVKESAGSDTVVRKLEKIVGGVVYALPDK